MSDERASPGPWRVDGRDVRAADGTTVCRADWNVNSDDGSDQRWVADSAFIASAPMLRDQRDRAAALLRNLLPEHPLDEPQSPETWERVRAFLAEVEKEGA